jgi:DNA polymerase-1
MLGLHPVVKMICDHREVTKLRTTYTGPLPAMVRADGRIYTVFKMARTDTGRLSCGDRKARPPAPNLQNIPTRGEWGALVRNGFCAGPGNVLVSADLSQIEMRLPACMAPDEAMLAIFRDGLDMHNRTACALFGLDIERVDWLAGGDALGLGALSEGESAEWKAFKKEKRLLAKTLSFAILYGVTPQGLQAQIMAAGGPETSVEECARYIAAWFAAYPGVARWLREQYERARAYGCVWTAFGRVRRIPGVASMARDVVADAERQAGNHPIQGTAGDLLKLIMAELGPIAGYYQSFAGETCWPLLQIHDELIFEASKPIARDFAHETREVMRGVLRGQLGPIDSSADIAERWGELK